MRRCRGEAEWLRVLLGLVAGLAASLLLAVPVSSQGSRAVRQRPTEFVNGREAAAQEVLVKFRDVQAATSRVHAEQQIEADRSEAVGGHGLRRLHSRTRDVAALLAALRANPDVEYAEPNYIVYAAITSNDLIPTLWGLSNEGVLPGSTAGADIDAPSAWNISTGSRANVVAVIDTGVDYTHPDLSANMWSAPTSFTVTIGGTPVTCEAGTHGFNVILKSCDPMDDNNHGTHVAGTIGAVGDNGIGVVGVNWTASIMGLKAMGTDGRGTVADAINAIEFAIQAKAFFAASAGANVRVLSNSWGGGDYSQALLNAINSANANDMLFVAAAGNNGQDNDEIPYYPASYAAPNVIAVAATDYTDNLASFVPTGASNFGQSSVHLAAPGHNIYSTILGNLYASYQGTSMATPHVSGAAALVLSECGLSTAALKDRLLTWVDALEVLSTKTTTGGRLNVARAIQACVPRSVTPTPTTVAAGATISVSVAGGPGYTTDWVGLYPSSASDTEFLTWQYLDGSMSRPGSGATDATLSFTAPMTLGTYDVRLFTRDGFTRLATSSTITVAPPTLTPVSTTVAAGATMSVTLANGPGNATDWVGLYPTAASDTAYLGWQYLNGTTTAPGTGVTGATLSFTAPTTPGTYEVRLFSSNSYTKLATSATLTVPSPTLTPAATTVAAGATIEATLAYGPGNTTDWVGLYATGTVDAAYLAWKYLNGAQTPPGVGVTGGALSFTAPKTPGSYEVRLFSNNSWTKLATSTTITVPAPGLTPTSATVAAGATISVTLSNGPGNTTDWLGLYATGTADAAYLAWKYLNGTTTPPGAGLTSATLSFTAPPTPGTYEVRLFSNNSWTKLTTSTAITVPAPALTPVSTTVAAGATISVTLSNGPGNTTDWVGLYATGTADAAYLAWKYLNGTQTPPGVGVTSGTFSFTAPTTPGTYEMRLFSSNSWTKVTTSAMITVPVPTLTPTPTTAAAGTPISVTLENGAGHPTDWVGLYPTAAGDVGGWMTWQYLNGAQTPPGTGLTGATLSFTAPITPGTYNVRLFSSNSYGKLATSATITVQ